MYLKHSKALASGYVFPSDTWKITYSELTKFKRRSI